MRISVIAAVMVGFLAGVAGAQPASDKARAQGLYGEGQERYAAGEYLPAAVKFEAAYALDPDPVYLFNLAQAYRLGNSCPKAVSYYRRFLDAVPNPPNLDDVRQYLAQSEACAKNQATMPPGSATSVPIVTTPPIVEPPPPQQPETLSDPGRTKRWAGIGAVFVGGVAVGLGIYYTTEVGRIEDKRIELRAGCKDMQLGCEPGYGDALDADGRRAQTRQIIAYTVGGVAIAGGVALYLLGRSSGERPAVAIVPTTGGAFAVGAFRF